MAVQQRRIRQLKLHFVRTLKSQYWHLKSKHSFSVWGAPVRCSKKLDHKKETFVWKALDARRMLANTRLRFLGTLFPRNADGRGHQSSSPRELIFFFFLHKHRHEINATRRGGRRAPGLTEWQDFWGPPRLMAVRFPILWHFSEEMRYRISRTHLARLLCWEEKCC